MKKTYISPSVKAVNLEIESLICQSVRMYSDGFILDDDDDTEGSGLVKGQNSDITGNNVWCSDEDW